jgi:uncharacterized paraquat-inducible protein A
MEPPQAFCPACQEKVAFTLTGGHKTCPRCGAAFAVDAFTPLSEPPPQATSATWLVLLALLLAPPVMTFLAAAARSETASTGIALAGSGVAAVTGALWLATRLNLHVGLRIGLAILLAPVFYGACFALCFAGCALGTPGGRKLGG